MTDPLDEDDRLLRITPFMTNCSHCESHAPKEMKVMVHICGDYDTDTPSQNYGIVNTPDGIQHITLLYYPRSRKIEVLLHNDDGTIEEVGLK